MAAVTEVCESNGAGETITHNITNSNMGNTDAANLVAASYPVTPGNRTYIKYQRIHVTNMGGSTAVQTLKVWRTGALGGSATHVTNARTAAYAGALAYATPVVTAVTNVDQTMPSASPASANLGIAGSLSGTITVAGYSDYCAHQIVTDIADTAGSTSTLNFSYEEIA